MVAAHETDLGNRRGREDVHAGETMNGVTATGGKPFSLRAARERNRIAEQHYNSTLNTFAGRASRNTLIL
jgi:hypothetical protein